MCIRDRRAGISDYVRYDMGPTSSMTIAAALRYAQGGFDGVVHLKSAGCTPEVDCIPVLQQVSRDTGLPILYLSYDSQTSDTGLDTRLEAFYDMLAMKKEKMCIRDRDGTERRENARCAEEHATHLLRTASPRGAFRQSMPSRGSCRSFGGTRTSSQPICFRASAVRHGGVTSSNFAQ